MGCAVAKKASKLSSAFVAQSLWDSLGGLRGLSGEHEQARTPELPLDELV